MSRKWRIVSNNLNIEFDTQLQTLEQIRNLLINRIVEIELWNPEGNILHCLKYDSRICITYLRREDDLGKTATDKNLIDSNETITFLHASGQRTTVNKVLTIAVEEGERVYRTFILNGSLDNNIECKECN